MEYIFNVEETAKEVIQWIKDWFAANGNEQTKAVIGISGGKDSSVVAKLLCEALGKERVVGVMMPNGVQKDISDSQKLCEILGIQTFTINIQDAYKGLTQEISSKLPESDFSYSVYNTNTPARLRMTTLYGISAIIGNSMVANTCNLSEDVMGYSTFYGDSAGSFSPICKLTTEEVVAIGDFLGLPESLTHKAPSDGMCGKTDEDNLGWTYHEVNEVVRKNIKGEHYEKIVQRWKRNKFKIEIIQLPCYQPDLPFYLEF
ncbi:MAG: NAD(+) synthase [Treponema sp.]|nr:NAD(+) synthase [Treponema sp.]